MNPISSRRITWETIVLISNEVCYDTVVERLFIAIDRLYAIDVFDEDNIKLALSSIADNKIMIFMLNVMEDK